MSMLNSSINSPFSFFQPMWFLSMSKEKNQYGQYLLKVIDELKETGNPNLD